MSDGRANERLLGPGPHPEIVPSQGRGAGVSCSSCRRGDGVVSHKDAHVSEPGAREGDLIWKPSRDEVVGAGRPPLR